MFSCESVTQHVFHVLIINNLVFFLWVKQDVWHWNLLSVTCKESCHNFEVDMPVMMNMVSFVHNVWWTHMTCTKNNGWQTTQNKRGHTNCQNQCHHISEGWWSYRKLNVQISSIKQPHVTRQKMFARFTWRRGGHLPLPDPHLPHQTSSSRNLPDTSSHRPSIAKYSQHFITVVSLGKSQPPRDIKSKDFFTNNSYSQFSITTGSHILVQFDHHQSHISDRCADIGFLSRTGGSFSGWCSARQSPHSHGSHWPGPVAPQPPTTFPSSVFSCHLLQPPPRLCLWFRLTYLVTKTQYVR